MTQNRLHVAIAQVWACFSTYRMLVHPMNRCGLSQVVAISRIAFKVIVHTHEAMPHHACTAAGIHASILAYMHQPWLVWMGLAIGTLATHTWHTCSTIGIQGRVGFAKFPKSDATLSSAAISTRT